MVCLFVSRVSLSLAHFGLILSLPGSLWSLSLSLSVWLDCLSVCPSVSQTNVLSRQTRDCRDNHVFVTTKHVFCRDKVMFVATNMCLSLQFFVVSTSFFCRDKSFVCPTDCPPGSDAVFCPNKERSFEPFMCLDQDYLLSEFQDRQTTYCSLCADLFKSRWHLHNGKKARWAHALTSASDAPPNWCCL